MSASLRDCFIKLHSRDLLGELKAGFQERYAGYVLRKGGIRRKKSAVEGDGSASFISVHSSKMKDGDPQNSHTAEQGIEKILEQIQNPIVMDVDSIAAEYGVSALPPLAIARDEKLLREIKEREQKAGLVEKSDAQMEAEEDKMFAQEEGNEDVDEAVQDDVHAEASLDGAEASAEVDKTKKGKKNAAKKGKKTKKDLATTSKRKPGSGRKTSMELYDLPAAFPDIPPRGDFDLEIIRDSPYFFS